MVRVSAAVMHHGESVLTHYSTFIHQIQRQVYTQQHAYSTYLMRQIIRKNLNLKTSINVNHSRANLLSFTKKKTHI